MAVEQGAKLGDTTSPKSDSMPADPGANAIMQPETTTATQPMDRTTATPPAASEAPQPAVSKDYPVCTRKVKDNCRNPGGK